MGKWRGLLKDLLNSCTLRYSDTLFGKLFQRGLSNFCKFVNLSELMLYKGVPTGSSHFV